MSAKRPFSTKTVVLPENLLWLEFTRSDGDPSAWPSKARTQRVVDAEGHVNFHRIVELDESQAVRWRMEVGAAVASQMGLLDGHRYVLKSWPSGYQLYDHHKGPQNDPRHDLYLFGPKGVRFRSINEFVPHAYWLLNPSGSCVCKYCSKRPQREISFALGLSQRSSASPTPGRIKPRINAPKMSDRKPGESKLREYHRPYAAVQRAPQPAKDRIKSPKYSMSRDRNNDLTAIHSQNGMLLKRWFREGELLWCSLDTPIPGRTPQEDIRFWPGLVQEVILKPEAIPIQDADTEMHDGTAQSSSSGPTQSNPTSSCPWTIRQYIIYKMKFLGVKHSASFRDDQVLPYQSYIVPAEIRQALETFSFKDIDLTSEVLHNFDPRAPPDDDSSISVRCFETAVGPYALAIQTAFLISNFWSPTDEWEFRYTIPPTSSAPPSRFEPSSLVGAIATASSSNAMLHNDDDALNSTTFRVLGPQPTPLSTAQTFSQLRYQGIWWGAERIWTDELVRLKVARKQLAPNGGENIYPSAGPGPSSIDYTVKISGGHESNPEGPEYGAEARTVFMKLEGLFVVELPKLDGSGEVRKECRVSGMLYELADEDWIDPYQGPPAPPETSVKVSVTNVGDIDPLLLFPVSTKPSSGSDRSPDAQLSHPVPLNCSLPLAPEGFKFRPILRPGCEAVMSLTLISGRYYPRLLRHPLLQPSITRALDESLEEGKGLQNSQHLWALEGLAPGFYNSVDPVKAKPDRMAMVKDAERMAVEELMRYREGELARDKEQEQGERDEMDVDSTAGN